MDDTPKLSDEELLIWTQLTDELGTLAAPRPGWRRVGGLVLGVLALGAGLRWPLLGGAGFLAVALTVTGWVQASRLGATLAGSPDRGGSPPR